MASSLQRHRGKRLCIDTFTASCWFCRSCLFHPTLELFIYGVSSLGVVADEARDCSHEYCLRHSCHFDRSGLMSSCCYESCTQLSSGIWASAAFQRLSPWEHHLFNFRFLSTAVIYQHRDLLGATCSCSIQPMLHAENHLHRALSMLHKHGFLSEPVLLAACRKTPIIIWYYQGIQKNFQSTLEVSLQWFDSLCQWNRLVKW